MSDIGKRFPFDAYPTGWFQVAYCPHLGADIAVGGTVTDDCITCPFHGWRFDGAGPNVEIPYAKTVNRTARLRAWPTAERAGAITEIRAWARQSYEEAYT
jgi:hypothetical protein